MTPYDVKMISIEPISETPPEPTWHPEVPPKEAGFPPHAFPGCSCPVGGMGMSTFHFSPFRPLLGTLTLREKYNSEIVWLHSPMLATSHYPLSDRRSRKPHSLWSWKWVGKVGFQGTPGGRHPLHCSYCEMKYPAPSYFKGALTLQDNEPSGSTGVGGNKTDYLSPDFLASFTGNLFL